MARIGEIRFPNHLRPGAKPQPLSSPAMTQKITADVSIQRWQGVAASELATAQSFVIDLCELLQVPKPHPTHEQDYMFERPVTFAHGDGSCSAGRIDCYRRSHFVLEAKELKTGTHTKGFDDGLLRARSQGEAYARALPAAEGRPLFVLVVDVGTVIVVHASDGDAAVRGLPCLAVSVVLQKLRTNQPLSAAEKALNEIALVGVLKSLHHELDAAVLAAYGWGDLSLPADTEALLLRLVALNTRRASEEAGGLVGWLRPEFQRGRGQGEQTAFDAAEDDTGAEAATDLESAAPATPVVAQKSWPACLALSASVLPQFRF
jgi:hypothetical protein